MTVMSVMANCHIGEEIYWQTQLASRVSISYFMLSIQSPTWRKKVEIVNKPTKFPSSSLNWLFLCLWIVSRYLFMQISISTNRSHQKKKKQKKKKNESINASYTGLKEHPVPTSASRGWHLSAIPSLIESTDFSKYRLITVFCPRFKIEHIKIHYREILKLSFLPVVGFYF